MLAYRRFATLFDKRREAIDDEVSRTQGNEPCFLVGTLPYPFALGHSVASV
jgi:hypothetical protein